MTYDNTLVFMFMSLFVLNLLRQKMLMFHHKNAKESRAQDSFTRNTSTYFSSTCTLSCDLLEQKVSAISSHWLNEVSHTNASILLPLYDNKRAAELLHQLVQTNATEVGEVTRSYQEAILLDMVMTWNVMSLAELLKFCHGDTVRHHRLQRFIVEAETCRHLHYHRHSQNQQQHQSAVPSLQHSSSVDMCALLSPRALHFLQVLCNNHRDNSLLAGPTLLTAKEVITGNTPDHKFNDIQRSLRTTGLLPPGISLQYWFLMFLRSVHVDVASLLRIVLLEIVRNCVHILEYSLWPISFLVNAVEDSLAKVAGAVRLPPGEDRTSSEEEMFKGVCGALEVVCSQLRRVD